MGSFPGLGRSPGVGNDILTLVFLPGKSRGQRSWVGYSPWGYKRVGHNSSTKRQTSETGKRCEGRYLRLLSEFSISRAQSGSSTTNSKDVCRQRSDSNVTSSGKSFMNVASSGKSFPPEHSRVVCCSLTPNYHPLQFLFS